MTSTSTAPDKNQHYSTSGSKLKRNLHVLIVSSSMIGAAIALHNSLMQPLLLQLGASLTMVGFVTSLSGLSILFPMYLGGEYSDSVGRKRPMILASLFLIMAGLIFWTATYWIMVIPAVLLAGFAIAFNGPASVAATSESVSKTRLGRAFAYRGSGRLLASVIATFLAIIVVQRNIQNAFILFTLFALINLIVVYFLLRETHQSPRPFSFTNLFENLRRNWHPPTKLKYIYLYIAVIDPFAYGIGWTLIYALLTDFWGVSSQRLLLYAMSASIAGSIIQLGGLAGRLADWSRKWSMVLANCISLPAILVLTLFPGEITYLSTFICMGISDAFFMPALHSHVVDNVNPERVASELGKLWSSRGIVGIFPPIIGGFLAVTYGFRTPLLVNVIVGLLALIVLIWKV
jgi:MFS family permease